MKHKIEISGLSPEQRKQVEKQLRKHRHRDFIANIRLEDFVLEGFSIHKGVFRADVMTSSHYLADFLLANKPLYERKTALDMGCGTGIQGIVMGLNGAKEVLLTDVSEEAVANAGKNMKKLGLGAKAKVLQSDLFENVNGKFDIIAFNHPFFPAEPLKEMQVSRSMLDSGTLIRRFLKEAKEHLTSDGLIVMPFFHLAGSVNDPKALAEEYGYSIFVERTTPNVRSGLQKGDFSIYVLKPKR